MEACLICLEACEEVACGHECACRYVAHAACRAKWEACVICRRQGSEPELERAWRRLREHVLRVHVLQQERGPAPYLRLKK